MRKWRVYCESSWSEITSQSCTTQSLVSYIVASIFDFLCVSLLRCSKNVVIGPLSVCGGSNLFFFLCSLLIINWKNAFYKTIDPGFLTIFSASQISRTIGCFLYILTKVSFKQLYFDIHTIESFSFVRTSFLHGLQKLNSNRYEFLLTVNRRLLSLNINDDEAEKI